MIAPYHRLFLVGYFSRVEKPNSKAGLSLLRTKNRDSWNPILLLFQIFGGVSLGPFLIKLGVFFRHCGSGRPPAPRNSARFARVRKLAARAHEYIIHRFHIVTLFVSLRDQSKFLALKTRTAL